MDRLYRISILFLVFICAYGCLYGTDVTVEAGDISHRLSGLNRAIEKSESFLTKEGILTTVITLKPEAKREKSVPTQRVVQSDSRVPASMDKNTVQDQFWSMLKERLNTDAIAQKKLENQSNVVLAKKTFVPQPTWQLPTDILELEVATDVPHADTKLSPEEKEELRGYSQTFMAQSMPQTMAQTAPQQTQPVASQPQAQPYTMPFNAPDQATVLALQMQMSAQALSNQATALMMQNGQRSVPMNYMQPGMPMIAMPQPMQVMPYAHESSPALPRSEKMSRLMNVLNQIMFSGVYSMQRLIILVDLEIDIIERLLAGETGARLEKVVAERNKTLTQSAPPIVSAYDLIIDLATTDAYGDADSRLYHYFVRSGKREKLHQSSKKKFLLSMMYAMKHYQEMLESIYNVSRATMTR